MYGAETQFLPVLSIPHKLGCWPGRTGTQVQVRDMLERRPGKAAVVEFGSPLMRAVVKASCSSGGEPKARVPQPAVCYHCKLYKVHHHCPRVTFTTVAHEAVQYGLPRIWDYV